MTSVSVKNGRVFIDGHEIRLCACSQQRAPWYERDRLTLGIVAAMSGFMLGTTVAVLVFTLAR